MASSTTKTGGQLTIPKFKVLLFEKKFLYIYAVVTRIKGWQSGNAKQ